MVEVEVTVFCDPVRIHNHHIAHIAPSTLQLLTKEQPQKPLWVRVEGEANDFVVVLCILSSTIKTHAVHITPTCQQILCPNKATVVRLSAVTVGPHPTMPPTQPTIHTATQVQFAFAAPTNTQKVPKSALCASLQRTFADRIVVEGATVPVRLAGEVAILRVRGVCVGGTETAAMAWSDTQTLWIQHNDTAPNESTISTDDLQTEHSSQFDQVVSLAKAALVGELAVPHGVVVTASRGCGKSHFLRSLQHVFSHSNTKCVLVHCKNADQDLRGIISHIATECGLRESNTGFVKTHVIETPVLILLDDFGSLSDLETKSGGFEVGELGVTQQKIGWAVETIARMIEAVCNLKERVCMVATAESEWDLPKRVLQVRQFEAVVPLPALSVASRGRIFECVLRNIEPPNAPLTTNTLFISTLADISRGFSASDIVQACKDAALKAIDTNSSGESMPRVDQESVLAAVLATSPSALRELRAFRPAQSLSQLAGYEEVKDQLKRAILWPLQRHNQMQTLGVRGAGGVLLYGQSGTGKTHFALGALGDAQLNVVEVRSTDIFSKYFGDSELAVRRIFETARRAAPCVIFIDELDSIGSTRDSEDGAGGVNARVLTTLLNEMDGIGQASGLLVVACTNRLEAIDSALLRPGRLDHHIHVPLPSTQDIELIFALLLKRHADSVHVGLEELIEEFGESIRTAADVEALFQGAGMCALRDDSTGIQGIHRVHFQNAATRWS